MINKDEIIIEYSVDGDNFGDLSVTLSEFNEHALRTAIAERAKRTGIKGKLTIESFKLAGDSFLDNIQEEHLNGLFNTIWDIKETQYSVYSAIDDQTTYHNFNPLLLQVTK